MLVCFDSGEVDDDDAGGDTSAQSNVTTIERQTDRLSRGDSKDQGTYSICNIGSAPSSRTAWDRATASAGHAFLLLLLLSSKYKVDTIGSFVSLILKLDRSSNDIRASPFGVCGSQSL